VRSLRPELPTAAITVTPGVGCAEYIIQTWLPGKARDFVLLNP
jgi:hypothetical protein